MENQKLMEKIIGSFRRYYNISRNPGESSFDAEAEFHSLDEQYFLSKQAKISASGSNEYVFFASVDKLTGKELRSLDAEAWQEGLSRVELCPGHKNTDVALVIAAEAIEPEAKKQLEKISHYKSYFFTLKGWSDYRLIAVEASTGTAVCNRRGESLRKPILRVLQERD